MTIRPHSRWLIAITVLVTACMTIPSSHARGQDDDGDSGVAPVNPKSRLAACGPAGCPLSARPATSPWVVYPQGPGGYTSYPVPRSNGSGCCPTPSPNRCRATTRWVPTSGTPGSMTNRMRQFFGVTRPTYTIESPRPQFTPIRTPSGPALSPVPADAFYPPQRSSTPNGVSLNRPSSLPQRPESPFYP